MKKNLLAVIFVPIFFATVQSQSNSNRKHFFPDAHNFSFIATADAPANILVNPAFLAIPRGQNFSYSLFLNDASMALEHHFQITGMPLLPLLSYRRASLGTEATVTNFYSLGRLVFGKGWRGLQSVIRKLDRIVESPEIGGLLLHIKNFTTSYPIFGLSGNLQELGAAIKRIRVAGKSVVAYLDADDAGGAFAGVAE